MRCKSLAHAQKQAETNAKSSGNVWVIIRDTNGQYHAESSLVTSPDLDIVIARFDPKPTFYRCGICECLHPIKWNGDCRKDNARFSADQLDEKYGSLGWQEVEMPVEL